MPSTPIGIERVAELRSWWMFPSTVKLQKNINSAGQGDDDE